MNKSRHFLSEAALALVCLAAQSLILTATPGANPLAVVYAQESPTETPTPAYTFEVSQLVGDVRVGRGWDQVKNQGVMPVVLTGDSNSIMSRYCASPDHALDCSTYTPSDLWQRINAMCQYHPEVCAPDPASGGNSSTAALELIQAGETLSAGDEIFTGDESGAGFRKSGGDPASAGKPFALAQRSSLNITEVGGTLDAPEIHLRLDAGLLATMPGGDFPSGANFQVALTDEASVEALPSTDGQTHLPAFMLGHDPDTGDVVISVLDGTVRFTLGQDTVDIPAGKRTEVKDSHDRYANQLFNPQVEPMTDQDLAVWVSALHYGDGDPSPFPILAHHLDSDPEPFPVYSMAHTPDGQISIEAAHTVEAPTGEGHGSTDGGG